MIKLSPADIARCQAIAAQHKGPIRKMMEQVAAETGVSVARIMSKRRDQTTVQARQLCMYLAVSAGFSRPQIGAAMGRDQSTVTHGYQAEKARRGE